MKKQKTDHQSKRSRPSRTELFLYNLAYEVETAFGILKSIGYKRIGEVFGIGSLGFAGYEINEEQREGIAHALGFVDACGFILSMKRGHLFQCAFIVTDRAPHRFPLFRQFVKEGFPNKLSKSGPPAGGDNDRAAR